VQTCCLQGQFALPDLDKDFAKKKRNGQRKSLKKKKKNCFRVCRQELENKILWKEFWYVIPGRKIDGKIKKKRRLWGSKSKHRGGKKVSNERSPGNL